MNDSNLTRRGVLLAASGVTLGAALPAPARANAPGQMEAAIRSIAGRAKIQKGKVTLDLPPLVENGNTVSMGVTVDSPMTKENHVKAIHVFNEKNPQPHVFDARLSPRNGKAAIATRIKLGDSQKIMAIAETSKGEFFSASADVIVTLAACLEDLT